MTAWLVILAVGVGTYVLRASMFVFVGRRTLPAWTATPMGFVAPAAVAALVASMVFTANGSIDAPPLPELAAVTTGFLAARRTGNVMLAFAFGMPTFWLLSALPL